MEATDRKSLVILGRLPALGVAELESLYGADQILPIGDGAALVSLAPSSVDFKRLGGSLKLGEVLTTLDTSNWEKVVNTLAKLAPELAKQSLQGKVKLGISAYGYGISPAKVSAGGLTIKKSLTKSGRSVRLVPNKTSDLNAASIIHNKLLGINGFELVLVKDGNKTLVARTSKVQDIDSYSLRDRSRPKRDTRVGMLPPKLAQIIVNLAASSNNPVDGFRILDPFCGTGVVLQEALLMGYEAFGTDIDARMADYSKQNLVWLEQNFKSGLPEPKLEVGDATSFRWQPPIGAVASETYLGRPFTSKPDAEILAQTASECNTILKKFLANLFDQTQLGTRLCLAVPAWQTGDGNFKHLPLIDQIEALGYNRVDFEHASSKDLLYYRPGQIVARELLVLTRK